MLTSNVIFLSAILLHVIVCFTPATLLTLANYHTLKARAAAHAVNMRARKQYKAAVAKSKANLAQRGTTTKTRTPRHSIGDENTKDVLEEIHPIKNAVTQTNGIDDDYPIDDSFMIHERSPEYSEYHSTYINPVKPFEVYSQEFHQTPENVETEYLTHAPLTNGKNDISSSRNVENQSQPKDANPHFHHIHNHQHSFSNIHGHGTKPFQNIYPVNQIPINNIPSTQVIQKQQTIIHKTDPPLHFPQTFPVTNQFGPSPNTQITINQNQALNNNLLKSAEFENGNVPETYEHVQDGEMVGSLSLTDHKPFEQDVDLYGANYPEPYHYSPLEFDPKKPENKQPLIDFIEDKDNAIKNLFENIKENKKNILEYDLEQKKFLIEYEKQQKKNMLELKKKQKKKLLEFKKHGIKSIFDMKTDKHHPKDIKHGDYMNYDKYPYPIQIYPLPSDLPNYEINDGAYTENLPHPKPNEYHDTGNQFPNNPYNTETIYPPNGFEETDQFKDPFHSWTHSYPKYSESRASNLRESAGSDEVQNPRNFVLQEMTPLETLYPPSQNIHEPSLSKIKGEFEGEARESDKNNEQMLMKVLENHPDLDGKVVLNQEDDPHLEYIIQIPERYSDNSYYERESRSVNHNNLSPDDIANILKKQKERLNSLKSDQNADLLFVKNVGNHMINEIEGHLNKMRVKRQENIQEKLWKRLFTDPSVRLNMPKTLENMGTATRETFEHEQAPLYHVRNMAGSAKNAVMAAMKIPNQPFMIPSKYDVIQRSENNEVLGALNPRLYSSNEKKDATDNERPANVETTFNKVGSVIKSTVQSGQEALSHIADIGSHAKYAIYNTRHLTPRMFKQKLPNHEEQTIIVTPKISDFVDENLLGATRRSPGQDFIKLGHIMDAVGASNPNNNLDYLKFILRKPLPKKKPSIISERLGTFLVGTAINKQNNVILGETLNTLHEVRKAFGANTLKEFFLNLKKMVMTMLKRNTAFNNISQHGIHRKVGPNEKRVTETTSNSSNIQLSPDEPSKVLVASRSDLSKELVGDRLFLPEELFHPFMRQPSDTQINDFLSRYKTQKIKPDKENSQGDPVVGEINKIMFENLNNERMQTENANETVSTAMKLQGQVLKPFLGQLKNKKQSFKHNTKLLEIGKNYQNDDLPLYIPDPFEPPYILNDSSEVHLDNIYM